MGLEYKCVEWRWIVFKGMKSEFCLKYVKNNGVIDEGINGLIMRKSSGETDKKMASLEELDNAIENAEKIVETLKQARIEME